MRTGSASNDIVKIVGNYNTLRQCATWRYLGTARYSLTRLKSVFMKRCGNQDTRYRILQAETCEKLMETAEYCELVYCSQYIVCAK